MNRLFNPRPVVDVSWRLTLQLQENYIKAAIKYYLSKATYRGGFIDG
jgi:hypothetical protein